MAAGGGALSAWQREERARREAKAAVEFLGDAWKPARARGGAGEAAQSGGRRGDMPAALNREAEREEERWTELQFLKFPGTKL